MKQVFNFVGLVAMSVGVVYFLRSYAEQDLLATCLMLTFSFFSLLASVRFGLGFSWVLMLAFSACAGVGLGDLFYSSIGVYFVLGVVMNILNKLASE